MKLSNMPRIGRLLVQGDSNQSNISHLASIDVRRDDGTFERGGQMIPLPQLQWRQQIRTGLAPLFPVGHCRESRPAHSERALMILHKQ
jgi:hypothetical protein